MGYVYLMMVALFFSFGGTCVKMIKPYFDPSMITFMRFFVGVLWLLLLKAVKHQSFRSDFRASLRSHWKWLIFGALSKFASYMAENTALSIGVSYGNILVQPVQMILMTVLLILWMIIHWYRHKTWTIAGSIRNMQESVYERQSRKKYPEYYERRDREEDPDREEQTEDPDEADPESTGTEESSSESQTGRDDSGPALLEDKGSIPFERIPDNRKAVEYEILHQDDQHSDGGGTGAVLDGMRQREQ